MAPRAPPGPPAERWESSSRERGGGGRGVWGAMPGAAVEGAGGERGGPLAGAAAAVRAAREYAVSGSPPPPPPPPSPPRPRPRPCSRLARSSPRGPEGPC